MHGLVISSHRYWCTPHTITFFHVFGRVCDWDEEKQEGRWGGGGEEIKNTTSKAPLNCTILSMEKHELCKSWPGAHIWQQSDCLVSRRFPQQHAGPGPLWKECGICKRDLAARRTCQVGGQWSGHSTLCAIEMSHKLRARSSLEWVQP